MRSLLLITVEFYTTTVFSCPVAGVAAVVGAVNGKVAKAAAGVDNIRRSNENCGFISRY